MLSSHARVPARQISVLMLRDSPRTARGAILGQTNLDTESTARSRMRRETVMCRIVTGICRCLGHGSQCLTCCRQQDDLVIDED